MEKSINDTIIVANRTFVENYENLLPQTKSLMDIDFFFSNLTKGVGDTFSSVNELFGSSATLHSDIARFPLSHADAQYFSYLNTIQYCVVLTLLIYGSLVYYKFSDRIHRLFELTFSFSILSRQLQTINRSIYISAVYCSFALVVLVPLIFYSNFKDAAVLDPYRLLSVPLYVELLVFCCALFIYSRIVHTLFKNSTRYHYFYKRINISEVVFLSAYSIILTPFVLLAFIENPYRETFVLLQNGIVIILLIHYLITNFKLFIEEKVSYIQSFLYFCTVKAVVISFVAYLGFLFLKLCEQ